MFLTTKKIRRSYVNENKKNIFNNFNDNYELYNYDNGEPYNVNDLVRDTNIRNNSNIVIV